MHPLTEHVQAVTRRHFFGRTGLGLGTAALASLLPDRALAKNANETKAKGGLPDVPHFAPKAKRAIYLFMAGEPCQMDMFDYKPKMQAMFNKDLPESIR
ncbi:MAG: DUF1501 domain-containing protein, partial [Planctomycetes bacterium]|nr:DUF1501 domain-containing protein [Planctomycetota bacterium]